MLKEACNVTLPAPECLLPNYTVPWDDNMSLSQVNEEIYYVTTVVTGTPITIIGLITSIVCTLVFSIYPITQKTTRYLLIINSVEDTLYLTLLSLIRLIGVMLRLGANVEYYYNNILDTIAKFVDFFRNWTIVFIAFERFMLICYPLYFNQNKSGNWLEWAFIGLAIVTLLIRTPTLLTFVFMYMDKCYENTIAFSIDGLTDALFFTLLPLCLLTFFTVRILLKTRSLQKWRKTHSARDSENTMAIERMNKRVHTTLMVVLISFLFLLSPFVPNGIIRIMVAFGNDDCMVHLFRYITAAMAYLGTLLNSSLNFFIYLMTWPKFRKCLWRLITTPFNCDLRNSKYTSEEKCKSAVSKRKSKPAVELNDTTDYTNDR